jgi:beta-lactamase regulating signal transducer with metallopeptidase domain
MSAFDTAAAFVVAALVDAAGRSVLLAGLAVAGVALFRVRSGAARLAVWRWVLCAALLMPVLGLLVPAIAIPVPAGDWPAPSPSRHGVSAATGPRAEIGPATGTGPRAHVSWVGAAGLIYVAGLLVFAIRMTRGWRAARDLSRRAATLTDEVLARRVATHATALALTSSPRLAESPAITVPVTAGVRRPVVLLPSSWRTWDVDTLDAVLLHEMSHISRGDALTQRLALAYRIVCWPNPVAWWLERHLAALAEAASDEAVLGSRVAPVRYAEILLDFLAVAGRSSPARQWHVAMARVTGAERRIHRVLTWKERRPMSHPTMRYVVAAAGAVALSGVVAAARLELLAAPVLLTVPAPPALDAPPPALPEAGVMVALPQPDRAPLPPPVRAVEPQAPTPQQSRPATPVDDFAKGAYAQDTPGLTLPVLTLSSHPKYTADAMRAKLQGEIRLDVVVGHEGYVTRARVAGVSGNLEFLGLDTQVEPARRNLGLDEEALAAVRQWKFQPGTLNGVAVPVLTSVHLSFRLAF